MHVVLGIALIVGLLVVHLVTAFGGPTLPIVKSSALKGYATTMDSNNSDDMPTVVDAHTPIVRHDCECTHRAQGCTEACDPDNFTVQPAYQAMVDAVFDLAKAYGIDPDEVMQALAAQVAEGDQR